MDFFMKQRRNHKMKIFQIAVLLIGVAAFLVAAFSAGSWIGDVLWRVGVAAMLSDLVCIRLWPAPENRRSKRRR
jgi:hypothetical protein